MSLLGGLRRMFGGASDAPEAGAVAGPADVAAKNEYVDSAMIRAGTDVWMALTGGFGGGLSEQAAMGLTAVYACDRLIAGAIASLPMPIYAKSDDGDLELAARHPLTGILNTAFCPRWSAASAWAFMASSRMMRGDAYAEILRGRNGEVRGLVPIHPSRVRVVVTPLGDRLIYEVQPEAGLKSAAARVLDQDDVLHVPGPGYDGKNGVSVLRHALRTSGRDALNAQEFSKRFLENMARPDFALRAKGNLSQDVFDRLKQELADRAGPANAGRPIILEGGLEITPLTMPLEDMQLLETRKFQVEEIARVFGVQPFMIGHTEKTSSWGSGVEAMGAGFVRYTLRDHLNAFHNEFNRKLFPNGGFSAEWDTLELERGDMKTMFETVRIGLGRAGEPAFIDQEEGRRLLRMSGKRIAAPDVAVA